MTSDHTAIVTGANHGIGAATAQALARRGCAVLCAFLRTDDPEDPGTPQRYRDNRARDASAVAGRIAEAGGTAVAVEADLSDPATPALLFDTAEERLAAIAVARQVPVTADLHLLPGPRARCAGRPHPAAGVRAVHRRGRPRVPRA